MLLMYAFELFRYVIELCEHCLITIYVVISMKV